MIRAPLFFVTKKLLGKLARVNDVKSPPTKESARVSNFELPLLSFRPGVPSEGLPILADWSVHAESIWSSGFEGWREAIEFKPISKDLKGHPVQYRSVEVTKGVGRVTILWFTLLHTYVNLKNDLADDELEDFKV